MSLPPDPISSSSPASSPSTRPRRAPSRRISDLVAHFEQPAGASSSPPSAPSPSRPPRPPAVRPQKTAAAPTVVIPAHVSGDADGRTRLAVQRRREVEAEENASGSGAGGGAQDEAERRLERAAEEPFCAAERAVEASTLPSSALPKPVTPPPAASPGIDFNPPPRYPQPASPPPKAKPSSLQPTSPSSPQRDPNFLPAPLPPYTATPESPAEPAPSSHPSPSTLSFRRPSTSDSVQIIPAYRLFARDAEPLVLPDLDRILEDLGGPADFTPMPSGEEFGAVGDEGTEGEGEGKREDEEWEMESLKPKGEKGNGPGDGGGFGSDPERKSWESWLAGPAPSLWTRLKNRFRSPGAVAATARHARAQRALVFPPYHLLPPELTVSDLKANRRKPPPLLSFQSFVLKASNGLLGAASSSYGIKMPSIEGLRDLMQMITLLVTAASPSLSTLTAGSTSTSAATEQNKSLFRTLFVTVPSFLSFDFVSVFGQALALLFILTLVTLLGLYELYRFTGSWHGPNGARGKLDLGEGYDREDLADRRRKKSFRDSYAWKVGVTFFVSSMYLPLSKLAIGALVWTDDYWPVSNPYELYDSDDPSPPSLGPSSQYYSSMDFCYRTTMRRRDGLHHVNWVAAILPVAVLVVLVLSLWLPWRLYLVVQRERPRVDNFTELGERRRHKNGEYERLLDSDPSPFNFLYREYRRRWATFRSLYLIVKLIGVLFTVVVSKNNCLFRSFTAQYLSIVRQGCLLAFFALFAVLSAWSSPYLDIPSNSSDIVSRFGYIVLAMLGLLAALSMPGTDGAVMATNVVIYTLNIYFALIGAGVCQHRVKRIQRRLDFSIDIFSPDVNLEKHISRRIWQETLAALFLCSPQLAMPAKEKLVFTQDDTLPPYLLDFQGTSAERLVENLKILREIGLPAYQDAIAYRDASPDSPMMRLRRTIQEQLTGPDRFYYPPDLVLPVSSFFGRIDVVPFPFVVTFRYDQHPSDPLILTDVDDLARLVEQNQSSTVAARRKVRLGLRALEGQLVYAPHVEVLQLGESGRNTVERHFHFTFATVKIEHNSSLTWRGYNYSSGFDFKLEYADGEGLDRDGKQQQHQRLILPGERFGVFDFFELTQPLAALFRRNRGIIEARCRLVEEKLEQHRHFFSYEADRKHWTLSHAFLLSVFSNDRLSLSELDQVVQATEKNPKVQSLARAYSATFRRLDEQMKAVKGDNVRAWWYLLWDDLYRRNSDILKKQLEHFSPFYRTSLCYIPMARSQLESFLSAHGFSTTGRNAFFHSGFLNQIYFYLDEQLFGSSAHAIPIHLASSSRLIPFPGLSCAISHRHISPMSLSARDATLRTDETGGRTVLSRFSAASSSGTQENDAVIRQRPAFLFEEVFERPAPPRSDPLAWIRFQLGERFVAKAKTWFGLNPLVRDWRPSEDEGVAFELRRGEYGGWEVPKKRNEGGVV
ncbi:hypothetical protein JCM8097_006120 [Rhodosporidiobolus ruineniae]